MNTTPILACIACGASAAIAGAAGWALRGAQAPQPAAPRVVLAQPAQPAAQAPREKAPLIAVSHDGNVTLHVEQQPLEWVLEQIALQGGAIEARPRIRSEAPKAITTAAAMPPVQAPCAEAAVDSTRVLQAIERGSDADRFDGLMQARNFQVVVPDGMLKTLYETDPSDRVRLAAFEAYLERYSGESPAMRTALEGALLVPSAAIQREARQRLDEMIERERIHAASPQGTPP